jgi:hypothetical protein
LNITIDNELIALHGYVKLRVLDALGTDAPVFWELKELISKTVTRPQHYINLIKSCKYRTSAFQENHFRRTFLTASTLTGFVI